MSSPKENMYTNMPLGKLCAMITKPYFGALTLGMEHLGIEKNFSVLILLEEKKNCSQQFISDTLQIDKVSMVKFIDGFVKKGLVKRVQNPKDRREYFVELTPKAHKILPEIHQTINGLNKIAFAGLSQKAIKDFYSTLNTVLANVKPFPSSHIIVYKTKKKIKI